MAQFARPDSDIDNPGSWTLSSGSNIYELLDETSAVDSDEVTLSTTSTTYQEFEVGLSNVTDPASSSGHIVRWRYELAGGSMTKAFQMRLMQGTTAIATDEVTLVAGGTAYTTREYTLSSGEADSITDYTDLRIEIATKRDGFGSATTSGISWLELEVPDAAASGQPMSLRSTTVPGSRAWHPRIT